MRVFVTFVVGVLLCADAVAQNFLEGEFDARVPKLEEVIGHAPGEEITAPDDAIRYMEALAEAAPDRMQLREYATSWEGRPLVYGVISSPENMARLAEIRNNLGRIGNGANLSEEDLAGLIEDTPAVTWLSYGVHGDEISSTDAGLALAYYLLASGGSTASKILEDTIVIIDPMQNPDGRARFVNSFEAARGLEPLADRYTAEHDQPWPGGRYNHYLFDMNRDWFSLTQPETVGRVREVQKWHPVVLVDAHEMGGDQSYFFPPSAEPFNPNITEAQREKQVIIGQGIARVFDRRGFPYFTREVFDAFYPGYGDMWPTLGGAIALTYEQASARGLRFERSDGSELTYGDGVEQHFYATLSTAETVADRHEVFLRDYAEYRREARVSGRASEERYFLMDLSKRRWQAEKLARQLAAQGIEVYRVEPGTEACGKTYAAGALVVDRAQPMEALIATLMEKETPLPDAFAENLESRRDRGLEPNLYDVTAWSLPLMSDVTTGTCDTVPLEEATRISASSAIPALAGGDADYGYAVPWSDSGQAQLVLAALRDGMTGRATTERFTIDGRTFPRGTVIFTRSANGEALAEQLNALAAEIGAETVALKSSWVESGPNFGSDNFKPLKAPRVAMVWGEGTTPTEAGATRYVIERELGVPVAPIRASTIARAELTRYDVLIVPDGWGLGGALSGAGTAMTGFVEQGGVLIGFGSAVDFLAREDMGLLSAERENAYSETEGGGGSEDEAGPVPGTLIEDEEAYGGAIAETEANPESVPGVLVNLRANTDHWLSSGYERAVALYTGSRIYKPLKRGTGVNVFRYARATNLLASGYLWEENRKQLAFKPYLMVEERGEGLVIGFTQSPVTRGYLDGLNLLVANAILLGPANAG